MFPLAGWVRGFSPSQAVLWLGAAFSSAVGLIFYLATAATIETAARARFENVATSAQYTINARIKSYTDVLRASASLFRTNSNLSRRQFHTFVEGLGLATNFPGIETINFAAYIADAERDAFEQRVRVELDSLNSGYPPFIIKPPGRRLDYTVVTYIEPISAWKGRFGSDLQARVEVAESIARSRDTGDVATSGTPLPFISGGREVGLGMRLPIYRSAEPPRTVEERRAAYVGTVGIGFNVGKLVKGVVEEVGLKSMRLVLVDIGLMHPPPSNQLRARRIVIFDNGGPGSKPGQEVGSDRSRFSKTLNIVFNQRIWEAQMSARKADLYSGFDEQSPLLATLAGFVSTALLFALYRTLLSSRQRAIKMATQMTSELRASQAKLQLSHEKLRRLVAHADNIKEGERKRIAREIHDDLGQNLLALRIDADMLALRTKSTHSKLHARARATVDQIDATIKSVRQIINDLRPNVLDLGLNAAVGWLVTDFRKRTGIACELVESDTDLGVGDQCATAFFRILQESLNNVVRHSHATRVRVELSFQERSLSMTVSDNGIGLQPDRRHKTGSFGLVGVEERVRILGGTFVFQSSPGEGTTITVAAPIDSGDGPTISEVSGSSATAPVPAIA